MTAFTAVVALETETTPADTEPVAVNGIVQIAAAGEATSNPPPSAMAKVRSSPRRR
jgi:hypothetical protein